MSRSTVYRSRQIEKEGFQWNPVMDRFEKKILLPIPKLTFLKFVEIFSGKKRWNQIIKNIRTNNLHYYHKPMTSQSLPPFFIFIEDESPHA